MHHIHMRLSGIFTYRGSMAYVTEMSTHLWVLIQHRLRSGSRVMIIPDTSVQYVYV